MHADRATRPVAMLALALLLTSLPVLAPPLVAQGGPNHLRMLLASGVACRSEPSVDAPVERRYLVGDVFYATGRADDGEADWYLDASRARGGSRGCWLYGPLTIEYDRGNPEPALLAAAERILSREEDVAFVEWVAVENLLLSASEPHGSSLLEASPLLELRRLQVIEGAVHSPGSDRWAAARDPLTRAWMLAHDDVIRPFEPSGGWMLVTEVFWRLYERHRDSEAADEIAWEAAQAAVPSDECYADCVLDRILRTYARYWTERPQGAHVEEALARATDQAAYAADLGCEWSQPAATRDLLDRVRTSLEPVNADQESLRRQLRAIEAACG